MKTLIEPFKIKMVEAIQQTTEKEREKILKDAHYNIFLVNAEHILIDFLTDSGCHMMQGYYFGRPMPEKELEHLLSQESLST